MRRSRSALFFIFVLVFLYGGSVKAREEFLLEHSDRLSRFVHSISFDIPLDAVAVQVISRTVLPIKEVNLDTAIREVVSEALTWQEREQRNFALTQVTVYWMRHDGRPAYRITVRGFVWPSRSGGEFITVRTQTMTRVALIWESLMRYAGELIRERVGTSCPRHWKLDLYAYEIDFVKDTLSLSGKAQVGPCLPPAPRTSS